MTLTRPERIYQRQIVELATLLGWRHYHTLNSKDSDAGWPDLVLLRPPRLLAVELKGPRGRLTGEQRSWLEMLSECAVETHVWRSGTDTLQDIARVLRSP
jgi:hypothetical protein